MRGYLWPTSPPVFSDFLVADPHAHGALQLSDGIDGSPRVRLDGAWRRARGVLIETDVAHAFDCDGQLTAIGWIEGESLLAEQSRPRSGRPAICPARRAAVRLPRGRARSRVRQDDWLPGGV